jgi:hypothetical protein
MKAAFGMKGALNSFIGFKALFLGLALLCLLSYTGRPSFLGNL